MSLNKKDLMQKGKPTDDTQRQEVSRKVPKGLRASPVDFLAGEQKDIPGRLYPYLPQEIVGGTIPHVPGMEEEAIWNAASQACGTEKVHFCYTVEDKYLYYLACPSSALASNPNSWCPLAAALPGNSEYWDKETVYLYEQEGIASALRWDPETGRMQVFLGASRTILPRVQSMDANFVTINAEVADLVPWQNRNLKSEKLARATARTLTFIGIAITLAAVGMIFFQYIYLNVVRANLNEVRMKTDQASMKLIEQGYAALQSDTIRHMVRIQEILDDLAKVDGTLVRYEVTGNSVEWEALIPQAFAKNFGTPQEKLEKDGRVRVTANR